MDVMNMLGIVDSDIKWTESTGTGSGRIRFCTVEDIVIVVPGSLAIGIYI